MTDSKRSGNNSLRSKLRGIKPEVIEQLERLELELNGPKHANLKPETC